MAQQWNYRGSLRGPEGEQGPQGVSITAAEVNASGDLVLTLSTGQEVNAGYVKGAAGGGIDFETAVATFADLGSSDPFGTARYVRDEGHLYVYESGDDRPEGADGWTDVGAIRGEPGATGPAGADGASVTTATINPAGSLIITLSDGSQLDAGVAKGAKGDPGASGADGAAGADGATVVVYSETPPDPGPYPSGSVAIDPDTGEFLVAV